MKPGQFIKYLKQIKILQFIDSPTVFFVLNMSSYNKIN